MSVHDKGHALCLLGQVEAGRALLDEAMAAVVGGELGPDAAGYVYCGMIGACSKLGDYGRSAEWTDATLRWCERESIPAFPGVCRIHRAELMRLRGSLAEAEEQARMACEELPRFNFFSGLGPANYEIGEVRRRRATSGVPRRPMHKRWDTASIPSPAWRSPSWVKASRIGRRRDQAVAGGCGRQPVSAGPAAGGAGGDRPGRR